MNARICTNPQCLSIMPTFKCALCDTPTKALPQISLAMVGIDGTAQLHHISHSGYHLHITTASSHHDLPVPVLDLLHTAQAHLPQLNAASGLMIMDGLSNVAALMRTRNSGHWSGWIHYLLDLLQDHSDAAAFQEVLKDLLQVIAITAVEDPVPQEPT